MVTPFFITTSIPYVNARPHVGFALEAVLADALARAHRDAGFDVRFQTGTDDNSLKNVRAADAAGLPVGVFVERNAAAFAALDDALDLSVDDRISTGSDPRHARGAQALWRACASQIEQRAYRGHYCVGCEEFVEARCGEHDAEPEEIAERNHFFRLSEHAGWLRTALTGGSIRIEPPARRNEVLAFVESGLRDISISRSVERARGWGVPVPGDPTQVQYVWFDALSNYITALGYPDQTPAYRRFWASEGRRVHVVGKNITRFHAVYWPAFLRAAGLPLPTTILAHGFLTEDGRKISKSRGGGLDPNALVDRFGADAVRYALLRHDAGADADLSVEQIERVTRAELADQLGNLVGRVGALIERRCGGSVSPPADPGPVERALLARAAEAERQARAAFLAFRPDRAIAAVRALVAEANRAIVTVAPWALDDGDERLRSHLATLRAVLEIVARVYRPIVPRAAAEIAARVGGPRVRSGPPLFPRSA